MALSPSIQEYLKSIPSISTSEDQTIDELRIFYEKRQKLINAQLPSHYLLIQDEIAPTAYGPTLVRIYRPPSNVPYPVLIFFHGGGFVFGNLDTLEGYCRDIAHHSQCIVISVDYPLAPEFPYPEATESCYAATQWICEHTEKWNGDKNKCFIGGSSAGATLALVVTMLIKERGGPKLRGQILLCPMTDTNFETASYNEFARGYSLTREMCKWFYSKYIPDPSLYTHPSIAPLRATDVKDLPPVLMVTAENDPLRDEGRAFARKLEQDGVKCEDICYSEMIHGFYILPLQLKQITNLHDAMKTFIRKYIDEE